MHSVLRLPSPVKKVKFHTEPRYIEIAGEVDDVLARNFNMEVTEAHETGQSVIPVVIHSPGGDVYALLSIMDTIRQSRLPVATILTGMAASAAAAIFTCGHRHMRFIAPSATIMFHGVSETMFGSQKAVDLEANAAEVKRLNSLLCKEMSRNIGRHEDFFEEFLKRKQNVDVWMSAQEAIDLGIASHIGMPVLVTDVTTKTSLQFLNGSDAVSSNLGGSAGLISLSAGLVAPAPHSGKTAREEAREAMAILRRSAAVSGRKGKKAAAVEESSTSSSSSDRDDDDEESGDSEEDKSKKVGGNKHAKSKLQVAKRLSRPVKAEPQAKKAKHVSSTDEEQDHSAAEEGEETSNALQEEASVVETGEEEAVDDEAEDSGTAAAAAVEEPAAPAPAQPGRAKGGRHHDSSSSQRDKRRVRSFTSR